MPTTPTSHGYTWDDLAEQPAEGLQPGDTFVVPGLGDGWHVRPDGSVTGAGVWALVPTGTAWTVLGRDGDGITARSHDGREATQHPKGRVLQVLATPTQAELRARHQVISQAADYLERAEAARARSLLDTIPGLNRSLDTEAVVRLLRETATAEGARGRTAGWVAQRILDAAVPAQLALSF